MRFNKIRLVVTLAFMVGLNPTAATLAQELSATVGSDFDGDGIPEQAELAVAESGEFEIYVGRSVARGTLVPLSEFDTPRAELRVIDIDRSDRARELLVNVRSEPDSARDDRTLIYRFDGRDLRLLVRANLSPPRVLGNGVLHFATWRMFWVQREKFVLDNENIALKRVAQPFYYVGAKGTAKGTLSLLHEAGGTVVVANARARTEVLVLIFDGTKESYLIKSADGLLGWVSEETLLNLVEVQDAG